MKEEIVTMGEIMLRLTPMNFKKFIQSDKFNIEYGGGEVNVAASLVNYGFETYFITALPKNDLGYLAEEKLKEYGINNEYIKYKEGRIGIYFSENGTSMRPSKVIYDRKNSAMSMASLDDFNFDEIFKNKSWFHISGITPAISKQAAILTKNAVLSAKKNNVKISFDLNYRKTLWSKEKAREVLEELFPYIDLFIGILDAPSQELNEFDLENIFKKMKEKYGFKYIASTLRSSISASDNIINALFYDGDKFYHSRKYPVRIVDRIGTGDAFAAGLLAGLLKYDDFQSAIEFAIAASAFKHTIEGDFNLSNIANIENIIGNIS